VTFRLHDSLPVDILKTLGHRFRSKLISEIEYHRAIQKALDLGRGVVHLKDPRIAHLVSEAILKFDGERFELLAWVLMPNHVHILLRTCKGYALKDVIHSIKSFTASEANRLLERKGRFWSPDYFDRFIRDRTHYTRTIEYIENNPVAAGLCSRPEEWPWGSAGWQDSVA